jgi:hypothetical protein
MLNIIKQERSIRMKQYNKIWVSTVIFSLICIAGYAQPPIPSTTPSTGNDLNSTPIYYSWTVNAPTISKLVSIVGTTGASFTGSGSLTVGTIAQRYFRYRTGAGAWTTTTPVSTAVSTLGAFSIATIAVAGLLPETTYEVQAVAANSDDSYIIYSASATFETPQLLIPVNPHLRNRMARP